MVEDLKNQYHASDLVNHKSKRQIFIWFGLALGHEISCITSASGTIDQKIGIDPNPETHVAVSRKISMFHFYGLDKRRGTRRQQSPKGASFL